MKKKYDIIYLTNLPSFYKKNLFNEIAKKKSLFVIFTNESSYQRNDDFYNGENNFQSYSLGSLKRIDKLIKLKNILKQNSYNKLLLGGYDSKELWLAAFISPKAKNGLIIESSIYESSVSGIKGFIKRLFIKKMSTVYVSGVAQKDLAINLGFKEDVIVTGGVGIFNIVKQPTFRSVNRVSKFLYVGRLSSEKNLAYLINIFKGFPELTLTIIGYGPEEKSLMDLAANNTSFIGPVPNKELSKYYQQNDVFILPSISEPWGLVVEEALNNGIPVIVSDKVGCYPEIITPDVNGMVFKLSDPLGLYNSIEKIQDVSYYNELRLNISKMDFCKRAEEQVNSYLK